MEFAVRRLELPEDTKNFYDFVSRDKNSKQWVIADSPIELGGVDWVFAQKFDTFPVKLLPYVVAARPEELFAYAMQLGVIAVTMVPEKLQISKMHLSIAYPLKKVSDESGDKCLFYFGLAFAVGS